MNSTNNGTTEPHTIFDDYLKLIWSVPEYLARFELNGRLSLIYGWAAVILFPTLAIIGLFGNAVTCWLFTKHRKEWRLNHVYLFFMSIIDTICIVFSVAYYGLYHGMFAQTQGQHYLTWFSHSSILCKIGTFATTAGCGISAIIMVVMSADRIYSLFAPFKHRQLTTKTAWIIIGVIVLCASLATIPQILNAAPYRTLLFNSVNFYNCWVHSSLKVASAYTSLLYFAILRGTLPVSILFVLNTILFFKVRRILSKSSKMSNSAEASTSSVKAAKTTIILSSVYLVFLVPASVEGTVMCLEYAMQTGPTVLGGLRQTFLLILYLTLEIFSFFIHAVNWLIYIYNVDFCYEDLSKNPVFRKLGFNPKNAKCNSSKSASSNKNSAKE